MLDAWRAYLEMALGLTEASRKKAEQLAGDLANRGGATAAQLQGLAEDLMTAALGNREALTNIVRYEVDRALGVVGLATAEEVAELTTRVRDLDRQLRDARARAVVTETASLPGAGGIRLDQSAPGPVVKKAVVKKAVANKVVGPVKATPNAMPAAGTTPSPPAANASPALAESDAEAPPAKEAIAKTPAPVAKTPAPVAKTPAPVAKTPAPVAKTPAPVAKAAAPPQAPAAKTAGVRKAPVAGVPAGPVKKAAARKAAAPAAPVKKAAARKAPIPVVPAAPVKKAGARKAAVPVVPAATAARKLPATATAAPAKKAAPKSAGPRNPQA